MSHGCALAVKHCSPRKAISTALPKSVIVGNGLRDRPHTLEPDQPLGDAVETFVRREHAERFIEEVSGDDPDLASYLRIEERELSKAGGLN